jgi:hypothetical protein
VAVSLSVLVGGSEVGGRLTGPLLIDAEEGAARVCEFAFLPAGAAPAIGAAVVVDLGATVFTGAIERAPRNVLTGVVSVRATDRLQQHAAGLTDAQILTAVTGSRLVLDIHGDRQSGWERLQDAMETTLGSVSLSGAGVLRYHGWQVSGTPAVTYTDYVEGSLDVQTPDLSRLTSVVKVRVEAGYIRRWHREIEVGWSGYSGADVADFCGWVAQPFLLPERQTVQAAAGGTDWKLKMARDGLSAGSATAGIAFEGLPGDGSYDCGGGPTAWALTAEAAQVATSASWTAFARYVQACREVFEITLSVTGAVEVTAEQGWKTDQPTGADNWEGEAGDGLMPSGGASVGGARYYDVVDRDAVSAVLHAAIGIAARDVAEAWREHALVFEVPIDTSRDLGQWVRLDCADGDWSGQVARLRHILDPISGRETSELTLAIGGATLPSYSLPASPITATGYSSIPAELALPTRVGNSDGAPPDDDDLDGWITNYQAADGEPEPEQVYQERFVVEYPEIPDDHREERTATATLAISLTGYTGGAA